eukprot:COSAG01_NODE_55330_length_326_cov_0.449339_1_plen_35_part_01
MRRNPPSGTCGHRPARWGVLEEAVRPESAGPGEDA